MMMWDDCASLPGPRASACVPVKCWVPERERSRGWGNGAAGCRHVGVSVCAGVCQRCCWPAWGHRRSGRGGLRRGATPAPGYSVQQREEQTEREYLMCVFECECSQKLRMCFLSPCRGWLWGHSWWSGTAVCRPAGRREEVWPSPPPPPLPPPPPAAADAAVAVAPPAFSSPVC